MRWRARRDRFHGIHLAGWALGAKVAVIAGAADRRVRGRGGGWHDSLRSPGKDNEAWSILEAS
jgi:hypothetical protein